MRAEQLLARLSAAGVRLQARGDKLIVGPACALDDELRALVRQHKPELLALLADLDKLLDRVAERYQWSAEDIAFCREPMARDPAAHVEIFRAWLAEPWLSVIA